MAAVAPDFSGVSVTTASPFHEDGSLDLHSLHRQVEFLADSGIRIVIPAGNTGEFFSLDASEAELVVKETVAAADGMTVLAGVGGPLPTAVALARAAEANGADAIMIHSASHTYLHRRAIADYILAIVESVSIPVALYKRGDTLPDDVLIELTRHDRIAAVKYAVNDLPAFAAAVERASAAMFCGTAERWAPFYSLAGAAGFTSGVANVVPSLSLMMAAALEAGDYPEAMRIRSVLDPFEAARARKLSANNVTVVKYALWRMGLDSGSVRAPLTGLDDEDRRFVNGILERWASEGLLRLDR